MTKYLSFLKFKFLTSLQFRTEVLIWIILDSLPFFILFLVWVSIYQENTIINGLTLSDTIFYYAVVSIIQGVTSTHFEGWRTEEVRMGKVDFFFIRPFSYLKEIVFSDFAGKLFYLTLFTPIYSVFLLFVVSSFGLTLPAVGSWQIIQFVVLILFAYWIELSIATLTVLLTFWLEGSQGIEHFKWIIITIFSGAMVPVEFMPAWLHAIVDYLPLKYMYSVPIQVIQGRYQLTFQDFFTVSVTVTILFTLIQFVHKRAILKYSSSGG